MNVIEALVPRGLLSIGSDILGAKVSSDGLVNIHLEWELGRFTSIRVLEIDESKNKKIVLPRLIEPHAHLDKAFTFHLASNLSGTYEGALAANLEEHKTRSLEVVKNRVDRSLKLALNNGLRAVRSHIDSFGSIAYPSWEALLGFQHYWKRVLELQLVAMCPIGFWNSGEGREFASFVASRKGLLGGVLLPPFKDRLMFQDLYKMVVLANELGCGIDFHIDESENYPAEGLKLLLRVLDEVNIDIPITCSHVSSLALLPNDQLRKIANNLAERKVMVVALPLTNGWLLGKEPGQTPLIRPIAPVKQLQRAGVLVAVGGDNLQDAWFPAGNFDPLAVMGTSFPLIQLAPWQRLGLAPFTTAAAKLMDLEFDGVFEVGRPADLVLLESSNWSEVLSVPPKRKVLINGSWFSK